MSLQTICDEKIEQLREIAGSNDPMILQSRAQALINKFGRIADGGDTSPEGCTQLIEAIQQYNRLSLLHAAKADQQLIDAVDAGAIKEGDWTKYTPLPVDESLHKKLAGQLMHSAFQHEEGGEFSPFNPEEAPIKRDKIMLHVGEHSRGVAEHIVSYMLSHDIPFDVDVANFLSKKALWENSTDEQLDALNAFNRDRYSSAKSRIAIISNAPAEFSEETGLDPDQKKYIKYTEGTKEYNAKIQSGEVFYTLTVLPTPADAELDGIPYQDYLKLFFEACDQPWNAIQKANNHLIDKLNEAKKVHIVDTETGTNLTMDLMDDNRWANSLTLKNIPGSEVFAAPVRESVNGTLVAKGKFKYGRGEIIEDITLIFKDGRVTDFHAAKGEEALKKFIESDDGKGEGTRFVGELAFGTNPWLKQHMVNGLLVEKISKSFHLALGNAYTYETYDGHPVKLNNGNVSESGKHWDITTMMTGKNSRIVLDEGTDKEYTVLKGGKYPDPALRVLDKGWAALHKSQQPEYWQERLAKQKEAGKQSQGKQ